MLNITTQPCTKSIELLISTRFTKRLVVDGGMLRGLCKDGVIGHLIHMHGCNWPGFESSVELGLKLDRA